MLIFFTDSRLDMLISAMLVKKNIYVEYHKYLKMIFIFPKAPLNLRDLTPYQTS